MNPKDQDPCGCVPRSQSRAIVILPGALPLDTTVPVTDPAEVETGEYPVIKPDPPQPPGWDAVT